MNEEGGELQKGGWEGPRKAGLRHSGPAPIPAPDHPGPAAAPQNPHSSNARPGPLPSAAYPSPRGPQYVPALQTGALGLLLSGEHRLCSGDLLRCRTRAGGGAALTSAVHRWVGDEQGDDTVPSSGGGGCGRGGLPRAPGAAPRVGLVPRVDVADAPVCVATVGLVRAAALPPPRVGLVLREAVRGPPPLLLPPEGPEAPPQQPPLLLPPPPPLPPLRVGLPCCCCCFSWNGTVALMGCRRLPAPPAMATAPPPREPAGVGDPLRLTRWDMVHPPR